jgi:hydroxymethylbilane synthase
MDSSAEKKITIAARNSKLSHAQVWEVFFALSVKHHVSFVPTWVDALVLEKKCRIAVHSAKDLPDPIPQGLKIIAITKGEDPSDALVLRANETLSTLKPGARIGTSCVRREEMVQALKSDLTCVDIRGTIEERLAKLDRFEVDGVVMAEAALIRLQLNPNRLPLQGDTAPLQGQLAILAREEDIEMQELFAVLDIRVL